MRYLVIHDVDAIQRYVFATNRLREIRGASVLIDQINRKATRDLVKTHGGELIYLGGGGAAADFANENDASQFSRAVGELYVNQTFTSSSTGVVERYDETLLPHDRGSFCGAIKRAHHHLREKKASRFRETQILTSPYFKRCQACGVYPVTHHDPYLPEQEGRFVCASCFTKRKWGGRQPAIHSFIRQMFRRRHNIEIGFPRELNDIGECAIPEGYIGIVYADGNRMGDRLQLIDNRNALGGFSCTIDRATRDAIASVLMNCQTLQRDTNGLILPVVIPLCGGDDLMVITPGHQALKIAVDYLKTFQDRVRRTLPSEVENRLGSREVSACAGVAIAKAHIPLSVLFDLAHDLCGLAKRRSYDLYLQDGREEPCVDFQVMTTPMLGEIEHIRNQQYMLRTDVRLTCRPYTVSETEGLIAAVQTLKREKIPSGKMYDLYRSLWKGRYQAILNYLMFYVRAKERDGGPKQKSALREVQHHLHVDPPPWRQWVGRRLAWESPYADLVEIYQFIEE